MNWSNVSRAPFATVKAGCPRCPACGWRAEPGPNGGVGLAMRIHCYREHGLRLRFGGGRGRVPETPGGVDLGAEVAAHAWVARSALRNAGGPADPEVEADALVGLMEAILTWDHRVGGGFATWANRIIRRIASDRRDHVTHRPRLAAWAGRSGQAHELALGLADDRAGWPEAAELAEEAARAAALVASGLLDGAERRVMEARFPARGDGRRHAEVAAARGVCEERVRQVERGALAKLRRAMGGGPGKPPRPAKPKPPEPGYFVVLAGPDRLPTALDAKSVLRPSRGEVAVFTDRRAARAMANRLRERCAASVAEAPPVKEGGATPWGPARLIDAVPVARARSDTVRATADAVRAALAEGRGARCRSGRSRGSSRRRGAQPGSGRSAARR